MATPKATSATISALPSRAIPLSNLARIDDCMEEAAVLTQLTFWIESARQSLEAVEHFLERRPEIRADLRESTNYTVVTWGSDESEGLQRVHNDLLGIYQQVRGLADRQEVQHA